MTEFSEAPPAAGGRDGIPAGSGGVPAAGQPGSGSAGSGGAGLGGPGAGGTGAGGNGSPPPRVPVGRSHRAEDEPPAKRAGFFGVVREIALVLGIALVLSLLIKTFLVQAFFIPSQSMENTLLKGDRVLVSKLTPGPFSLKRGDIIVFKDPDHWLPASEDASEGPIRDGLRNGLTWVGLLPSQSDEHLIKRVIGLGGDTVACCDSQGRLTVNGKSIDEPYIYPGDKPSIDDFSDKVPPGDLWVMGDHRSMSEDSRRHTPGFVPVKDVVGRAFVLVWPLDRFTLLRNPSATFAGVPDP